MAETPQPYQNDNETYIERLVDTQGISYHDARLIAGAADTPDPALEARQAAHDYYAEEFRLTGPIHNSKEDVLRTHAGAALARADLRQSRESE